jgi:hypothetical protein
MTASNDTEALVKLNRCYLKKSWQGSKSRVARWYIFKTKIPIWVNLGVLEWKMLVYSMAIGSILRPFSIFVVIYIVNFMVIWKFFLVLVCCTKKNLAIRSRSAVPNQRSRIPGQIVLSARNPNYA